MKKIILFTLIFLFASVLAIGGAITVINNNDSGSGSLRDAVTNAIPGDTILFDNSLMGDTIALSSGTITVDKELTILGFDQQNLITISGKGISRIFLLEDSIAVSLSYLKFIYGLSSSAGAILNKSSLYISYCRFSYNEAHITANTHGGGAIYNSAGAEALIEYCEFLNNAIYGPMPTSVSYGGAIRNEGVLMEIKFCTFNANSSLSQHVSYGGAIHNSTTMIIENSTFSGNDSDGPSVARAGAISNYFSGADLTLVNCSFVGNIANSSNAHGGAIWNNKFINLKNCLFESNGASNGGDNVYTNSSLGITTSMGYNIFEDTVDTRINFTSGDFIGTALTNSLNYNGNSFTQTHSLSCSSPAVNTGDSIGNINMLDQANGFRIIGSNIDIGAYELQSDLVKPTINISGLDLSVSKIGNYQWYFNNSPSIGDTLSSLSVVNNGDYFVIVTDSAGCSLNSDTVTINTVGIKNYQMDDLLIYPNPFEEKLNIKLC